MYNFLFKQHKYVCIILNIFSSVVNNRVSPLSLYFCFLLHTYTHIRLAMKTRILRRRPPVSPSLSHQRFNHSSSLLDHTGLLLIRSVTDIVSCNTQLPDNQRSRRAKNILRSCRICISLITQFTRVIKTFIRTVGL